jgi:hypothetical protein
MSHITVIISKAKERKDANPLQEQPALFVTLEHDVTEDDFVEVARLAFRRLHE